MSKESDSPQYTSRIEEIIETYMIIAMPMQKGYPVFYPQGKMFYGKVFTDVGIFSFTTIYVDRKMSPLPIWIVKIPSNLEKTQQRSFVRFDIALPILFEYLVEHEEGEMISLKLMTKDLSGGGVQLISEKPVKVGKKVYVTLDLPDFGTFKIDGQVVRSHQPLDDRKLFWISVKFLGVPNNIRDKIIRFIVRRQLEQRQKGL